MSTIGIITKTIECRGVFMNKETARPQLTAYECMLIVCSKLVQKGKTILRLDNLAPILFNFKDNVNTKMLFEDIAFKRNIDTITSADIEESLCKLQTFGAIGKLNPAYEKIVIYITPEEADNFLQTYAEYNTPAEIISEAFKI